MAETDNEQKTEQPTGKRLSEAMEQGQFARSPELQTVFVIAGALAALSFTSKQMSQDISDFTISTFAQIAHYRIQLNSAPTTITNLILLCGRLVAPLLVACMIAAILAGGLQSGFQLTPKAVGLKLERLNPMPGLQRMFTKATWTHFLIDCLKLIAIGFVLWGLTKTLMKDPMFTAPIEAAYVGEYLQRSMWAFLSRLLLALGCIAAISYAYEKMKTHKDMMMTREEVKEEQKQMEGSALAKGAMRRLARRLLQRQMLGAVPTADVVVTNPTHYAVALKYERGIDKAPVVLAKGENGLAKRIKAIAAENGVPMVEDRPVARALYAFGKVGEPIPSELYQAVAKILAFVYRTHRYYFYRLKARRTELQSKQDREGTSPRRSGQAA